MDGTLLLLAIGILIAAVFATLATVMGTLLGMLWLVAETNPGAPLEKDRIRHPGTWSGVCAGLCLVCLVLIAIMAKAMIEL